MATIADLGSSKYIKQTDVQPPILVTISGYKKQNVAKADETPEHKFVLFFKETEKGLVLNTTNGNLIADITGDKDLDGWEGKKIVLFNDESIYFSGKKVGGVRARAPKAGAKEKAPVATSADELEDDDLPPF